MLGRVFSLPLTIRQLLSSPTNLSSTIEVNGWVKSVRRQKRISFAVISDGSSSSGIQAVFNDPGLAKNLTNGACVRLSGKLAKSIGAGQEKELQVESVQVLGECDPTTYPMQKQTLSTDYLRDHCHLRARTEEAGAMLRLRGSTLTSLREYFEGQGFCYAHTPILTSNDCEGAGDAFRVAPLPSRSNDSLRNDTEFFSRPSYLTVSSQLHLEALSSAISRVYTLSPCFRAERSQTNRHLAEFWMLEAEWAFTRELDDVCQVVEAALKKVLQNGSKEDLSVLWRSGEEAKLRALEVASSSGNAWTRMTYANAVTELSKHQQEFQFRVMWGNALQSEHERWLAETLVRGPVFVTDYPVSLKPFYMRRNEDDKTVACFDLLVPHVGELAGGSLREERAEVLEKSLAVHGLREREYGWYLDLRRQGGAPHGGFGLGFERLIGWLGGIENVRECIAMPRWAGRMLL